MQKCVGCWKNQWMLVGVDGLRNDFRPMALLASN
jgi:predicted DNA-binding transcriptional regulator YafY